MFYLFAMQLCHHHRHQSRRLHLCQVKDHKLIATIHTFNAAAFYQILYFSQSAPAFTRTESIKKNVPQPSNPLKSFNWSKLPDAKVQGTIWSELDDSKLYTNIELENIDKLFCAYQKNGVPVSVHRLNFFALC